MPFATPAEHLEFRQLAEIYAHAVDRRQPELFELIATDDISIIGPSFQAHGLKEVQGIPAMLSARYLATRHAVHNILVTIEGDTAQGSLICTADHLWRNADGGFEQVRWYLRYEDEFARLAEGWRFRTRRVRVDWSDEVEVPWVSGQDLPLARLPGNGDQPRAGHILERARG